jgi:MoxR-like ATPase
VLSLGLPDRQAEREIVTGAGGVDLLGKIQPVTDPQEVAEAITATAALYCNDAVVDYILDLSEATRTEARLSQGVSPRASSSLLRLSQGHAAVAGRDYVTPDDVQAVFVAAFAHRVMVADRIDTAAATQVLAWMLTQVPVPRV